MWMQSGSLISRAMSMPEEHLPLHGHRRSPPVDSVESDLAQGGQLNRKTSIFSIEE
jgi:hypothetical protein